jgi:hypothetical protein
VAPKSKAEIARSHLEKAREEAGQNDLADAVQWSFACLEAAIDAISEMHGIAVDKNHWRRSQAATELYGKGVLPKDLAPLHRLLNEERKAVFYEGEDPDLGDLPIEDVLEDLQTAVEIAERDAG